MRSGRTDNSVCVYRVSGKKLNEKIKVRTLSCEVEERGEGLAVRHDRVVLSKLVEEWMNHGFDGSKACLWCVLEQLRHQRDRLGRGTRTEHLKFVSALYVAYTPTPWYQPWGTGEA